MKQFLSLVFIILLFTFSCGKGTSVQGASENVDSLKVHSNRITNTISETLTPFAKKAVSEWKEYKNVDAFILKFYNISVADALYESKELSELVQLMKDSIRVEILKGKSIIARFNVLHNETLRLADMATISAITDEEVAQEVTKILNLYSAVNSKINTIYKAQALQKSLEFDTETPILQSNDKDKIPQQRIKSRELLNAEKVIRPKGLTKPKIGKAVISEDKKRKQ
jgi:tellurite resistance protein